MNKSESIKAIAAALCNFQNEVGKIKKGETNPFFKSKYASLADILDVIQKPLSNNELAFVQFPEGEHQLTTMLLHTSGEWMAATYSMTPAKNDPQGLGSVITYQRRYALGAVLGLNIDDDDDGNAASTPPKAKQSDANKAFEQLESDPNYQKAWAKKPQQSDANFKGMTEQKQILSDKNFNIYLMRAKDGEVGVFEKMQQVFNMTTEQINEWRKETGI